MHSGTSDLAGRVYTAPVGEAGGRFPLFQESLETLDLTENGSQRKVKDAEELTKMAHYRGGPDMRSHRKFWAEHLK